MKHWMFELTKTLQRNIQIWQIVDRSDDMAKLSSGTRQPGISCWLVVHQFLEQLSGFLILIQQRLKHQGAWQPALNLPEQLIWEQPSSPCLQISAQRHMSWSPNGWEQTRNFCSQSPSINFLSLMLSDFLKNPILEGSWCDSGERCSLQLPSTLHRKKSQKEKTFYGLFPPSFSMPFCHIMSLPLTGFFHFSWTKKKSSSL